jgi:hypothetical protein
MQLLAYVRNHGGAHARRVVGIAVGTDPRIEDASDRPVTSFVEFRVDADIDDPATELQVVVAKAFATSGVAEPWTPLEFDAGRARLRIMVEPGFADVRSVLEPLLPLLRACRVRAGTLVTAPAPRARMASA